MDNDESIPPVRRKYKKFPHIPSCKIGVYAIRHRETGDEYIGGSIAMRQRWWAHARDLYRGKHSSKKLQAVWDRDGPGAFEFVVLEECQPAILRTRERYYLDIRKPAYNANRLHTSAYSTLKEAPPLVPKDNHKRKVHGQKVLETYLKNVEEVCSLLWDYYRDTIQDKIEGN